MLNKTGQNADVSSAMIMEMSSRLATKFAVGRVLTSVFALQNLTQGEILDALSRHQTGDWGKVSREQGSLNELALVNSLRITSIYPGSCGRDFMIQTEADRSTTSILPT